MPIVIQPPFLIDSYKLILQNCGGTPIAAFCEIGVELTGRYFNQLQLPAPSAAYQQSLWAGIWQVVHREGLPRPLTPQEIGEPKALDDDYLFSLAGEILGQLPLHRADDVLKTLCVQILTALLAPEFKACRQSYTALDPAGACVRQQLSHCRDRVSGAHCEDCPFFVALSQGKHHRLLARSWTALGEPEGEKHFAVFLPEDFRSLRVFWHLHLRAQPLTPTAQP